MKIFCVLVLLKVAASYKVFSNLEAAPLDVVCSSVSGGCPDFDAIEVSDSGIEGRSYHTIDLALIELGRTEFSRSEYEDAEHRLKHYMNGGNLGNEVIDAMFPVQQLILYEADGQRVYRNYVGVSFPKGTNKLPIPLDAGIQFHKNYQTEAYVLSFGGVLDVAHQADIYDQKFAELEERLSAAGVQVDTNVRIVMEYGHRFDSHEARREVAFLSHLAKSSNYGSLDDICASAPGNCPSFSPIPVSGSNKVEGRAYDAIIISLIELSKDPYNQRDYEDAVNRLHAYVDGDNAASEAVPAMLPVQQLILYEADGRTVYRNYVAVSLPTETKAVPAPNDANIQFHLNYPVDAFVVTRKAASDNAEPSFEKDFGDLAADLDDAGVVFDKNVKIILDYGARYDPHEQRQEVGFLRHLA